MYKRQGWSKTTTYTVIKKCIDKKAVSRSEPGFVCHPLVSREEVREQETDALIDRMYGGSADLLVANLLGSRRLSPEELARRCGVSRQTINAIENNKYDPTLALAFHLAAELGVRVDELFTPDSSAQA